MYYYTPESDPDWWIGYRFPSAVTVTSIGVQMRHDIQSTWGHEWQYADVEWSDDGIYWYKEGYIAPLIAQQDISYKTVPVLYDLYQIKGTTLQDNGVVSRFVLVHDWGTGNFITKIKPFSDGTWEYKSRNGNAVLVTHVGAAGFEPKSDGAITPMKPSV